jgi:hypothetical protein
MSSRLQRSALLPVALCLAVLAFTGCGGKTSTATSAPGATTTASAKTAPSTTSSTSTAAAPTAQSTGFVAEADAICRRGNAEIEAIKLNSGSAKEIERAAPPTMAIEQRVITALAKLDAPASLAHDWQRILGYRRTLAGELGTLLSDAKHNDTAALKPLAASKKQAHAELTATARANGFKDCGKIGAVG